MGLEINGSLPAGNNNQRSMSLQFGRPAEKKSVFVMNKDGSQTEQIYENGKLASSIIRYDKNGDGKFEDNEMFCIDRYSYEKDGTAYVRRFVDEDGDGYNDTLTTYEFDKGGNLKSSKTYYEEDINKVKNRPHMEHEIRNRSMKSHQSGMYIR